MTNLGLQACPKFQFGTACLNLSISQVIFVQFIHHAYFYEVLELSRPKNDLQKSQLKIHKPLAFWTVTFAARGRLFYQLNTVQPLNTRQTI